MKKPLFVFVRLTPDTERIGYPLSMAGITAIAIADVNPETKHPRRVTLHQENAGQRTVLVQQVDDEPLSKLLVEAASNQLNGKVARNNPALQEALRAAADEYGAACSAFNTARFNQSKQPAPAVEEAVAPATRRTRRASSAGAAAEEEQLTIPETDNHEDAAH